MRIANNLSAMGAFRALNSTNKSVERTIDALSTGLRINSASDDAAGFAVSEKMRSQISGLDTAIRNTQDGMSLLQTAEGALDQTNAMLQRMRDLSVQASNDSLTSQDRQYIQLEIDQIRDEIDRIAGTTQFNKKRILDGSSGALWSSSDSGVRIRVKGGLTSTDNFGHKVSAEGNYKIDVTATAGGLQVQKSNIMLVKHKNVAMEKTINHKAGINNVSINNLPAGYYALTSEEPTEARAVATCSYGLELDELYDAINASVSRDKLKNNASILFEVTDIDENSGEITLSAVSHVLKTDGTTETYRQEDINLVQGKRTDLSELLGVGLTGTDPDEADGAFELQLQSGKSGDFKVGYKFVYNLTVAKDVEGADRCVKITSDQNSSWPDGWQETMEIQTSNSFEQPAGSIQARLLFVIDDSSSMQGAISTVARSLDEFIKKIANEQVDEVSVGIATYSNANDGTSYTQRLKKYPINGSDWASVDNNNTTARDQALADIKTTLQSISVPGGGIDHYYGIKAAIDEYALPADSIKNYVVLVTDAKRQESTGDNGVTRADVKQALENTNTQLVTICPSQVDGLFQSSNSSDALTDSEWSVAYDKTGEWASKLIAEDGIGSKIGEDTVQSALFGNVPLYEFPQMQGVFPDASATPQVITIHQGDNSYNVTIEPTDTFATFSKKLNDNTGASTKAQVVDLENGKKAIRMATSIPSGERVTYSGNQELITQLGLRSNFDQKFSLDADKVTNQDIHFRNFFINKNTGHVHEGDIVLTTNTAPSFRNMIF